MTWTTFFTDAVLRGPTIASMLMCFTAALVGVIVFVRRRCLLGEALSHAAYPGVILGLFLGNFLMGYTAENWIFSAGVILGGFLTSWIGLKLINWLENKWRIHQDISFCLILAGFFGIGITIASRVQITHTSLYIKMQSYLYGQVATMTDQHILIYAILSIIIVGMVIFFYRQLQVVSFDKSFARNLGINTHWIDLFSSALIVIAIIIGIRCVGIVLMSAMLIAPATCARQLTHRFHVMFFIAGGMGLLTGFLGNFISVSFPIKIYQGAETVVFLPTGPTIALTTSVICFLLLLLGFRRGMVPYMIKSQLFRYNYVQENILQIMLKEPNLHIDHKYFYKKLGIKSWMSHWHMYWLKKNGLVIRSSGYFYLTELGKNRAQYIIDWRLAWERCLSMRIQLPQEMSELDHVDKMIQDHLKEKIEMIPEESFGYTLTNREMV